MFALINSFVSAVLLSVSTLSSPTLPGEHSVDASAFVTASKQIRVSVVKPAAQKATVLLKDSQNHVLYQQQLSKGSEKSSFLFTVSDLADGQYQIEVRSNESSIVKQVNLSTTQAEPVRQIVMQ